jgi:hypothetical protein
MQPMQPIRSCGCVTGILLVWACTPSDPRGALRAAPEAVPAASVERAEPAAEPPERLEPLAPPEPLEPPRRYENEIYFAESQRGVGWRVDIIDLDAEAFERAVQANEAAMPEDADSLEDLLVLIPTDSPAIPFGWKVGDEWTVITAAGPMQRRVLGFQADRGAMEGHFSVLLADPEERDRELALAIRGTELPGGLVFRTPPPVDLAMLGPDPIEAVRTIVIAAAPRVAKRPYTRASIDARSLQAHEGRFPGGRTHVVVLDAPPPRGSPGWKPTRVSALLMHQDCSSLPCDSSYEVIALPAVHGGWIKVHAIMDVDGDGLDEIFWEDEYYEGSYWKVLEWKDGAPHVRTRSGDGA